MSDSATPWTAAHQAPPSMGFSRQEYWSEVPLPSPKNKLTVFKKQNRGLHRNLRKATRAQQLEKARERYEDGKSKQ